MDLISLASAVKTASRRLATASAGEKDRALAAMADRLLVHEADILAANAADLEAAKAAGIRPALLDRLALSPARLQGMAAGLREVAALPDPIGEVVEGGVRPNGLEIRKVRVPLGVIGIIYEARPNVTSDAAALCLKSGNGALLRGGKEAIRSNTAVIGALREGLETAGLPADCVALVTDVSRQTAADMMRLNGYLDLLIPRGGAGLIRSVVENATLPVIQTGVGNCHVYADAAADIPMATRIIVNAKASRPSVCNAAETLLVHRAIAAEALPVMAAALKEAGVTLRGCPETCALIPEAVPAVEEDWATEYGDYILAVKVVGSLEEAVAHIGTYGTGHSECIVTGDLNAARRFTAEVDAAAVYVNASTRFTDGGEFGLGCEIGISTQKLHARGPMGLRELTSVKYVVYGDGQCR